MEAFSDGVLAIIITIMVLKIQLPRIAELCELYAVLPLFLAYVLSYIYVGIYWVNHHHLLCFVDRVSGSVLSVSYTHLDVYKRQPLLSP